MASRYGFRFEDKAIEPLRGYFNERIKDTNFGNGREARSFVENCQMTMADRLMRLPQRKRTKTVLQLFTKKDVLETISKLSSNDKQQSGVLCRYGFR